MKNLLLKHTIFGLKYEKWTLVEATLYMVQAAARELNICPLFWRNCYEKMVYPKYVKRFRRQSGNTSWFDIGGAKLADISTDTDMLRCLLPYVLEDTFCVFLYLNENYDHRLLKKLDPYMGEGTYGLVDGQFDVRVQSGDIVIDAGAWIGDFSAYAAAKGAVSYAFEPVNHIFKRLQKTAALNEGLVFPIKKGLGEKSAEAEASLGGMGNSVVFQRAGGTQKIEITSIDEFVEQNRLSRINFIKADIEGSERDMLRGATETLKKFAPKLAICTYHLPDDPEVLESIIKEANPDYTVVQMRHKLYAAVIK